MGSHLCFYILRGLRVDLKSRAILVPSLRAVSKLKGATLSCSFYLIRGAGHSLVPRVGRRETLGASPSKVFFYSQINKKTTVYFLNLQTKHISKYNTYASATSSSITRWSLCSRWTLRKCAISFQLTQILSPFKSLHMRNLHKSVPFVLAPRGNP